jgi:hypothetical protein
MATHYERYLHKTRVSGRAANFLEKSLIKNHALTKTAWTSSATVSVKPFRKRVAMVLIKRLKELTVDQLRKAAGADPQALHVVPDRKEVAGIFTDTAGETLD